VMVIFLSMVALALISTRSLSQQLKFDHVLGKSDGDAFLSIAQDKYGFMWFTRGLKGLQRYDGKVLKSHLNDPLDSNSLSDNYIECLVIDSENIFWIGTFGSGLDRFDPATKKFTHFRHNDKDISSLSNDTITALLVDRAGDVWIGSLKGLDLLDKKTGKFTHFVHRPEDAESLSNNEVRIIYEDRSGTVWVGCGIPFGSPNQRQEDGGLNRLNKNTGKFTRYMHDPANPESISNNKVRVIFEDSKENFWIGTGGDGLQTLDRNTGIFTHYYFDKSRPEKLSRPSQIFQDGEPMDFICSITEDSYGSLLIGTYLQGVNYYNPIEKKVSHHGYLYDSYRGRASSADTLTGLTDDRLWQSFTSKDGLIWFATLNGNIFNIKPRAPHISYYTLNTSLPDVNALYCEPNDTVLWIGTDSGLLRRNLKDLTQKAWTHDPLNEQSLSNDTIASMKVDDQGKFWLATVNGLCRFDPITDTFQTWRHDEKNSESISSNSLTYLFIDHDKNIWIGTANSGVDKLNVETNVFTNYRHDTNNSKSLSNNNIYGINEDQQKHLWIATVRGLNRLDNSGKNIDRYLPNSLVTSVFTDASGVVWASTENSLFRFDKVNNQFQLYKDPNLNEEIRETINIMEDNEKNLWISTTQTLIKINDSREKIKIYDESNGVHSNTFAYADNFIGGDGKIFLGDQNGYYAFLPNQLLDKDTPPLVILTGFKIGELEIGPGEGSILDATMPDAKSIHLNHDQNNFSFEFEAISYTKLKEKKFLFKLENYDKTWHFTGTERKAYFYNIPPGEYVFRVKAVASDGTWGEKTVSIILTPPWWNTWWAYGMYVLIFISVVWIGYSYQRQQVIRFEREKSREKELAQAKEIEKAYTELKATQAQLIQSEKMASLGELTAGIAHEIQNPLNFVNNFSEVNEELLSELKAELSSGKTEDALALASNAIENQKKIYYHGKRADAIVKGMLQHSRTSSGTKEPTNINSLCDEYLRLSYHGLRAKDKTFNAKFEKNLDSTIEKINVIPQDIGRVILNLINNAFYAVTEKKKLLVNENYEPTVTVTTKRMDAHKIQISIKDNGNGIPESLKDKIFQPFFTTKPTGQGTGLGLSLSYDIVKAHGGELKVETQEREGSKFIIQLPG